MPNQTDEIVKPINWGKVGILFSTLAAVIFVCAFGYGYFVLSQSTIGLAQAVDELQAQMKNSQQSVEELRQAAEKAQQKSQASAAEDQAASELYLRLTTLDNQLDQLPLLISNVPTKVETQIQTARIDTTALPWWQAAWERFLQILSKIVIVRNIGTNTQPLISPEEKPFLYQNLHAQIASAMWGALHHNANAYQASLVRANAWVQRYFAQDALETKNVLQELQDLQKVNVAVTAQ
jgi:hypothetical protein